MKKPKSGEIVSDVEDLIEETQELVRKVPFVLNTRRYTASYAQAGLAIYEEFIMPTQEGVLRGRNLQRERLLMFKLRRQRAVATQTTAAKDDDVPDLQITDVGLEASVSSLSSSALSSPPLLANRTYSNRELERLLVQRSRAQIYHTLEQRRKERLLKEEREAEEAAEAAIWEMSDGESVADTYSWGSISDNDSTVSNSEDSDHVDETQQSDDEETNAITQNDALRSDGVLSTSPEHSTSLIANMTNDAAQETGVDLLQVDVRPPDASEVGRTDSSNASDSDDSDDDKLVFPARALDNSDIPVDPELRRFLDIEAEESEDEFTRRSNAGDEDDGDNLEDKSMNDFIVHGKERGDASRARAYWLEREVEEDQEFVDRLAKDIRTGALSKRHKGPVLLDDEYDSDEERQRRKRVRQRRSESDEFAYSDSDVSSLDAYDREAMETYGQNLGVMDIENPFEEMLGSAIYHGHESDAESNVTVSALDELINSEFMSI